MNKITKEQFEELVQRGEDVRALNLYGANLSGANLYDANLSGANLHGANLSDITINWDSHLLLSEILVRAASGDHDKGMFAAYIRVRSDMCWGKWMTEFKDDPRLEWALRELAKWYKEGDGVPDCVLKFVEVKEA